MGSFTLRRLCVERGFTLIELLIVVAIIAILAAIAVPNFLEAQVRSKVARVRNDMRTISVGMEAYMVDHNRYPIPSDQFGALIGNPATAVSVSPMETRVPVLLTTPVAYLASRPEDPFAVVRWGESRVYHLITENYVELRHTNLPVHNWRNVYRRFFTQLIGSTPPSPVLYFVQSWGPDEIHNADVPHTGPVLGPHVHSKAALYDPTNGTTSDGDILYFGPGLGFMN